MDNPLISFGSGIAIGALATGALKLLGVAALGIGIGIGVRRLLSKDTKEHDECKSGQKQN